MQKPKLRMSIIMMIARLTLKVTMRVPLMKTMKMAQLQETVWRLSGRVWYPAKVCSLTDVPENIQHLFCNNQQKLILKWYGEDNYFLVQERKVERLAENNVDAQRASRSTAMMVLYNTALHISVLYSTLLYFIILYCKVLY